MEILIGFMDIYHNFHCSNLQTLTPKEVFVILYYINQMYDRRFYY